MEWDFNLLCYGFFKIPKIDYLKNILKHFYKKYFVIFFMSYNIMN
jgi:hypothetical protein